MQAKYDKAIAIGMAGVLLLFISLFIFSYALGVGVGASGSYGDELLWGLTCLLSTFCTLFVIGFGSAFITYGDTSSCRDMIEISSLAGAIPLSLVSLVIIYLALHAGPSTFLSYAAIGLAILIPGILSSAIGGIVGRKVFAAMMERKTIE